jgi:type 2 lantibiotic biosynthesis protein LanM
MESFEEVELNISIDDIFNIYHHADLSKVISDPLLDYIHARRPVAFQELFIPVVRFAAEKLWGRFFTFSGSAEPAKLAPCSYNTISLMNENAILSLQYNLLEILSVVSSKVLEMEFSLYRMRYQSALDRFLSGNISTTLYNSFINKHYEKNFLELLKEYPGMLKLFAVVTNQWLETTNELLSRLETDIAEIQKVFNNGMDTGKVTDIDMGVSDRHNGGRTVAIISLDSGFKLAYKPRSLGMEETWFNLLHYLNKEFSQDLFKFVKVLNKDTYGWMEYMEHLPCSDEDEIMQYYRRAGAILCMVHLLRGTDCHYQNLIAHGSYPVLIDLETLFHSYTRELYINTEEYSAEDMENYYSVLRTGLLPGKGFVQDGKTFDLSGFGGGTAGYPKMHQWVDVNTDSMRQEYTDRKSTLPSNLPSVKDKFFSASNYVGEISNGFWEVYVYMMREKSKFLSLELFLAFANQKCRFVFRPTALYFALLSKSIEPKYLKSRIEIDVLNEEIRKGSDHSYVLSPKEFSCLLAFDIPYLYMDTNHNDIEIYNTETSLLLFSKSAFDSVQEKILKLHYTDLRKQTKIIRNSIQKLRQNCKNIEIFH